MTKIGRKILVGIDEGEESTYALSWCLKNLVCKEHNTNDTIILLHVKPRTVFAHMDSIGYFFPFDTLATVEKYSNELAQGLLDKAKKISEGLINDQILVETLLLSGDPKDVLCEVAESLNVDILVMGSHGYGVIKRTILGSVSHHCAQNVKCPVLIVKKPKSYGADH